MYLFLKVGITYFSIKRLQQYTLLMQLVSIKLIKNIKCFYMFDHYIINNFHIKTLEFFGFWEIIVIDLFSTKSELFKNHYYIAQNIFYLFWIHGVFSFNLYFWNVGTYIL